MSTAGHIKDSTQATNQAQRNLIILGQSLLKIIAANQKIRKGNNSTTIVHRARYRQICSSMLLNMAAMANLFTIDPRDLESNDDPEGSPGRQSD